MDEPTKVFSGDSETEAVVTETGDASAQLVRSERDDLREAAEQAMAASGEEVEAPAGDAPAPKPAPKDATAKEPPAAAEPKPLSKLAGTIRARDQAQKMREQAQAERQQMLSETHRELEAAKRERAEAQSERERLQRLRASPLEAIRELGWDTTDLVNSVAREGSPEWQMIQKERVARAQVEAKLADMEKWRASQDDLQRRQQSQYHEAKRAHVVREFLGGIAEDSALRTLYDDSEILAKGDFIADQYQKETGQVASIEEIRDYLEGKARERLERLRGQASGATGKTAPKAPKAGNGQRTLSSSTSSERRAAPKHFSELKTPSEQRQALVEAANDALRTG